MTCSQTGGMIVGAEGVIKVGMVSGGLGGGGGGVEASGAAGEPEGVSGDTRPLGQWTLGGVVPRGSGDRQ